MYNFSQASQIEEVEKCIAEGYKKSHGPFFISIGESLSQLHIHRQAYHGATFVGNHVHKMLQVL